MSTFCIPQVFSLMLSFWQRIRALHSLVAHTILCYTSIVARILDTKRIDHTSKSFFLILAHDQGIPL